MQEVVRELFSWEQLAAGTELYLAGSSAGGTGVLINLDPIAELVRTLGSRMRVRGIVDSGWFLDNDPFSASNKVARSPSATVAQGTQLWRARVPDSCAQAFPGEQWKCFFGYRIYPTMTSKCSPGFDNHVLTAALSQVLSLCSSGNLTRHKCERTMLGHRQRRPSGTSSITRAET